MASSDRTRSGGRPPELALPGALIALYDAVQAFEHAEIDAALVRAQIADRCRDAGVEPVAPEAFDAAAGELDGDGWRRLSALAALWGRPEAAPAVTAVLRLQGAAAVVTATLSLARAKPKLTMAVLRMSGLRVEELARGWLDALGVAIAGETAAQSAAALQRLDYERLLAQAEQAREAAEKRMEQLAKDQEADDRKRRTRRGKW